MAFCQSSPSHPVAAAKPPSTFSFHFLFCQSSKARLLLLLNVNIIYSHSRKLTESLKTFVNPLLPAWCCLTSFKFSFRSFFFRFFCLVSCFLSQFKRKSANYLLQICKRNVFFFKAQDERLN